MSIFVSGKIGITKTLNSKAIYIKQINMKNYFPHDSDARSDDKIIALRIKHKWEGYGYTGR